MRHCYLLIALLLAFCAPGGSTTPISAKTGDGAFYVSPKGSDRNPGTLSLPFLTPAKCQSAMERASSKTCYLRAGTYKLSATLPLTSSDSGETWQYYPSDGVDTAILNGDDSLGTGISIERSANVTINGISLQHFAHFGIRAYDSPGTVIENNEVAFISDRAVPANVGDAAAVTVGDHVTVKNNYVHDTAGAGITSYAYTAGTSIDGTVIAGNVVLLTCQTLGDCGAIYTNMLGTSVAGGVVMITNNFVRDYGASRLTGDMIGIYLDDLSSNVTVAGNVIGPPTNGAVNAGNRRNTAAIFVNSDSYNGTPITKTENNAIEGNIIDLGNSGMVITAALGGTQQKFTNNIVLSHFRGSLGSQVGNDVGYAYYVDRGSSNTIARNFYYNYAFGGSVYFNSVNGVGDTAPVTGAIPQITSHVYSIAAGSPASNAPTSFPPVSGKWGPPGFAIPPSTNHSCP
jgi:hypothetical protein